MIIIHIPTQLHATLEGQSSGPQWVGNHVLCVIP